MVKTRPCGTPGCTLLDGHDGICPPLMPSPGNRKRPRADVVASSTKQAAKEPRTGDCAEALRRPHSLVGRRVSVHWDGDGRSYEGAVREWSQTSGHHLVVYDDKTQRWEALSDPALGWSIIGNGVSNVKSPGRATTSKSANARATASKSANRRRVPASETSEVEGEGGVEGAGAGKGSSVSVASGGRPEQAVSQRVIDKLVASRGVGADVKYLVRWKGRGALHDSWEPSRGLLTWARFDESF